MSLAVGVVGVALAGAVIPIVACDTYTPALLEPEPLRVPARDGVGWWSGEGDRGCFSTRTPTAESRPKNTSPADLGPITMAFSSMRLGSLDRAGNLDANAWKDIGMDLDGRCTGSDTCEGQDSPFTCAPTVPQVAYDGNYCRDNTFGRLEYQAGLVPEISKKYGLSDDAFNCALCVGHYNFLVRVSGYNGEADDESVRLDLYPSPGLEQVLPWNCADPTWTQRPCFTPDMPWTVQSDVLAEPRGGPDLPDSVLFDDQAYVRQGYIVASLPDDTLFWFPGYKALVVAYPIRFQRSVVTGRLARGNDGSWRIENGVIAGRSRGADIIKSFRLIGFCESDPNYRLMSDFVEKNLDITADGSSDPNVTCDAMSVGLSFEALQATAGKVATVAPLVECRVPVRAGADAGP